jgi:methylated-DNA-[protein]-cysteine S-methyltransferase
MSARKPDIKKISRSLFETALGAGGVVAGEAGLLEVFPPFGGENAVAMAARIAERYPDAVDESDITRRAASLLTRYFAGEPVVFDITIDFRDFTPFQEAIYRMVSTIPRGEVRSYSRVASDSGRPRAARGVGAAMARNPLPIIIPCHRVVGKSGELTGYSAVVGIDSKRWLLETERKVNEESCSNYKGG